MIRTHTSQFGWWALNNYAKVAFMQPSLVFLSGNVIRDGPTPAVREIDSPRSYLLLLNYMFYVVKNNNNNKYYFIQAHVLILQHRSPNKKSDASRYTL